MTENLEGTSASVVATSKIDAPAVTSSTNGHISVSQSSVAVIPNDNKVLGTTALATTSSVANRNVSEDENFENLQKAVQILAKAKTLDDNKHYPEALKLYREGVDILLEELIVRQGTDQSRTYLRDKCNDFMNRIDQLKLVIQIEKTTLAVESKEKEKDKSST